MLKPSRKNTRRRNQARRSQRRARPTVSRESPHTAAIRRLRIELQAEEGLFCYFHGGVDWRCAQNLLPRGAKVIVEIERPVVAGGRRYVPDLKVSCARTGRPLLLIEVWHSHPVNPNKRNAYNAHGLPWVEVKSWHVLHRYRQRPLPVLDWGGAGMPDAPYQWALFEPAEPVAAVSSDIPKSRVPKNRPPRNLQWPQQASVQPVAAPSDREVLPAPAHTAAPGYACPPSGLFAAQTLS